MFAPINPQNEERRAQAMLSSLTQYEKAVELFAHKSSKVETAESATNPSRNYGQSIMRVFNALKRSRRPVVEEPVRNPVYSPRRVTTSG